MYKQFIKDKGEKQKFTQDTNMMQVSKVLTIQQFF